MSFDTLIIIGKVTFRREADAMAVSYNKLFKLLIDKKMKKKEKNSRAIIHCPANSTINKYISLMNSVKLVRDAESS